MSDVIDFGDAKARKVLGLPADTEIKDGGQLILTQKGERLLKQTGTRYQKFLRLIEKAQKRGVQQDTFVRAFLALADSTNKLLDYVAALEATPEQLERGLTPEQAMQQAECALINHLLYDKGVIGVLDEASDRLVEQELIEEEPLH